MSAKTLRSQITTEQLLKTSNVSSQHGYGKIIIGFTRAHKLCGGNIQLAFPKTDYYLVVFSCSSYREFGWFVWVLLLLVEIWLNLLWYIWYSRQIPWFSISFGVCIVLITCLNIRFVQLLVCLRL